MSNSGAILAAGIQTDLKDLTVLVERAKHGWEKAKIQHDDYSLDGVALNLHGFYTGLEKFSKKSQPLSMAVCRPLQTGIRNCCDK